VLRFLLEMIRDDSERGEFGPHIAEHIMIAGGLVVFALAYIVFMAPSVSDPIMRKMTQVIALVPALVAFLLLRPASFADQTLLQFSTSQWVAILTAIPAAMAYGVYFKAAEAHPESALAIDLTEYRRAHPEVVEASTPAGADEGPSTGASGAPASPRKAGEETAPSSASGGDKGEAPRAPIDDATRPSTDENSA
jgi:phosphatidylglycerol:prolipoprotein diacylglycerol transferase